MANELVSAITEEVVKTDQEDGLNPKVTEPENQEKKAEGETPAKPEPKPEEPEWAIKKIGKLTAEKYGWKEKYFAEKAKNQSLTQKPIVPNPLEFTDDYGKLDRVKYNLSMETWHNDMVNFNNNQNQAIQEKEEVDQEKQENNIRLQNQAVELSKRYTDYFDVTDKKIFTEESIDSISTFDDSGELLYYLGKSEDKIERKSHFKRSDSNHSGG
jgi:hypothetical protein